MGGGAARHTPTSRSLLDRSLGRCLGFATSSPTPSPVSEAAPQCQHGHVGNGALEPYTGQPFRTFRKLTRPGRKDAHGQGADIGFLLSPRGPWASCTRQQHPVSLKCGKSFGVSPVYGPSPESGPCLFLPVLSPTNLCVTIASGQSPVWLYSPLAWGSTADESHLPGSGRQGGFPREGSPADKHSGRYCIYSPQR